MRRLKRAAAAVLFLLLVVLIGLPRWFDRGVNRAARPRPVSSRARALFETLELADLHADSLLLGRDLLRKSTRGQVDVPRLIEGRVALQVFGVVTKAPYHLAGSNDGRSDAITLLAWVARWPWATHRSLAARALYQASRLADFSVRSKGRLVLIRSSADLKQYLELRRSNPDMTAGLLAVEGAQALEGNLDDLDRFYEAGVRMMSPTHFFDTEMGGSAHGKVKGGLTPLGRRWLEEMEKRKMIVDVAHASPQTVADVLALAKRPVVVSHTGVRGTCDNQRNLSDEQLRAVAKNDGLIGIGYWTMAVCGRDPDAVARAIRHAVDVAGIAHVALGSDFDGVVRTPFDAAHLDQLVEALQKQGFTGDEVRLVMGRNALDFLVRNLP